MFVRSVNSFKNGDFTKYVSKNFKNARVNNAKRSNVEKRLFQATPDDAAEEDSIFVDNQNVEGRVINQLQKKNVADQLQLIDHILESAKIQSEPTMRAIIEGVKRGESVYAIAKSLGIHHSTVDRKIRRLSRFYNPDVHGDICDYLPEGIRIKREFVNEAV